MVALVNSSLELSSSYNGDNIHRLLQEGDEARSLYSNVVHDLGRMDFHFNVMQDALTISENSANTVQSRLVEAEASNIDEIFYCDSYSCNLVCTNL